MNLPTHRERQLLQYLRGAGWVKVFMLPPSAKVIANMLEKGWIEQTGTGAELAYRITQKGLAAKKALVRIL
jgi:hypothetical protein